MAQKAYRVRNWAQYNKALVKRGDLTIWFTQDLIDQWYAQAHTGQRGRPRHYSDHAIQCGLVLRELFQLPLRNTQGLVRSIIHQLGLPLKDFDYTTLCRRQSGLPVKLAGKKKLSLDEPLKIVIDSSGIKIYGEGEWKVKQHGASKRRTWRKLHIGVDPNAKTIVVAKVTGAKVHDTKALPDLLAAVGQPIKQVCLDGIYDTGMSYEAVTKCDAIPIIPPRKGARLSKKSEAGWQWRNWAITQCRYHTRAVWKQHTGYHQRSLAENAFYRLKTIFGHHAKNRRFDHQETEILLRCHILNRMTALGMPDTVPI